MSQSIYPVPAHIKDATLVDKNKYVILVLATDSGPRNPKKIIPGNLLKRDVHVEKS